MNAQQKVRIWPEEISIPTYLAGEPDRNPMFLEKRVYQGASGRVYPYPVIDKISDERVDEKHRVVFLENRFLKLMVMPDFGGRIQFAYDKTNNYPFIYHNHVIKPALVGLAGPWLSGGIEFNWPQHHRPGTYCPVNFTITENPDGSSTLWLSETEPMLHLKSTLALTLYPDKAFLEIKIRLFNPTPLPQSFHLWTNPAVHVNNNYQSVFPPDVQAVYDHGKRDVSEFPIARGEYYKVDYSRGVDISWYKNLPVPTSYMAAHSDYDFVGGYDHGKQAGVLHVADHHVIPGKKQWVWGSGDFGKAWDRNLTDTDGPYAELMCGVFADNQPDFSWLQPFEEKEVKQFFLPYKKIGYVRNATIHAAVSMEIANDKANIGAYASSVRERARVCLSLRGKVVWEKRLDLSPENPLATEISVPRKATPQEFCLEVFSDEKELLVAYTPEPKHARAIPNPATAIPEPAKVKSNEALYLAGLHLEQYRHATREPEDYYREALRRDPADIRNHNALGLLLLRRGQFTKSEKFFRAAIKTQTRHNPNPCDGEPYFNLGLCLRFLGKSDEAFDAFYKATWNSAWQDAGFFQLAQLASLRGDFVQALDFIDRSLARNANNQKAIHLKTILLRKFGRIAEAKTLAEAAIARDPLDFGARNELQKVAQASSLRSGNSTNEILELASDYAHAGAFDDAIEMLEYGAFGVPPSGGSDRRVNAELQTGRAPGHIGESGMPNLRPMIFYFLGYYASQQCDDKSARKYFRLAARQNPERCFPNSLDSILALQTAMKLNPRDARAAFYLGNLWYDKRQFAEAVACWEQSRKADPKFPTAHRNLSLAYFNKQHQPAKALRSLERAFALDETDARVLFELDLLKKRVAVSPEKRFTFLKKHFSVVQAREDLLVEFITLLNLFGEHERALQLLSERNFHPWEGGEGKTTGQYVVALVGMAKRRNGAAAIELLKRARNYPHNLGEGKLHGAQENHIVYWLGVAHEQLGQTETAKSFWREASIGMKEPAPAVYYNDQNPETIFYQGLALEKLGKTAAAKQRFNTLIRSGKKHLRDKIVIDYFAVSLPEFMVFDDDMDRRNQIICRYLMALGFAGLGKKSSAFTEMREVLRLDPNHQAARLHLKYFQNLD